MILNYSILILAAGASSRMKGDIKQLLPWKSTTLLGNAIQQAKGITNSAYVVLGANAHIIKKTLDLGVEIIENPNWKSGMGSSISVGLSQILQKIQPDALLILLADQPLVDAELLSEMFQEYERGTSKIVATAYQNRAGVPAIFDSSLFPELQNLNADFGAKKIIEKYKKSTKTIHPNGKEVDVDTKEKYLQLIDKQNSISG